MPTPATNATTSSPTVHPDLTAEQRKEVGDLLREFSDRLDERPGLTDQGVHRIELKDDRPVRSKPYPTPYGKREVIREEVQKMREMGLVLPSQSPFASPVVLVSKKDGTHRFCVDYRKLNNATRFDAEPVPDQEHMFTLLRGARYLSKLDLSKGYWQVPVAPKDKEKTAFVTHDGLFEWNVMPFGLINSGATFSRLMRKVLSGLEHTFNYIDDIIVATRTWDAHVSALKQLFERLRQFGLTAKPSKCTFGAPTIDFLGHQVGRDTLRTEDEKVDKILQSTRPRTQSEMRSFLGLVAYYARFVPGFAAMTTPLRNSLKKGCPRNITWNDEKERAFAELKKKISNAPILHLPDLEQELVLQTDASTQGLGAVLLQDTDQGLLPIAYASRALRGPETRYSTCELECLAIVWATKKFEKYLYGTPFTLQTDHQPLTFLFSAELENPRLARWALLLQRFQFRIEAIPGTENAGADYLSRCPAPEMESE